MMLFIVFVFSLPMSTISALVADISGYPNYNGILEVSGTVQLSEATNGIYLQYNFIGLLPYSTGGWHIHVGKSCSQNKLVGDHYLAPSMIHDPWVSVTYTADIQGKAEGKINMPDFSLHQIENRTIVVHDADGTRVGCGEIYQGSNIVEKKSALDGQKLLHEANLVALNRLISKINERITTKENERAKSKSRRDTAQRVVDLATGNINFVVDNRTAILGQLRQVREEIIQLRTSLANKIAGKTEYEAELHEAISTMKSKQELMNAEVARVRSKSIISKGVIIELEKLLETSPPTPLPTHSPTHSPTVSPTIGNNAVMITCYLHHYVLTNPAWVDYQQTQLRDIVAAVLNRTRENIFASLALVFRTPAGEPDPMSKYKVAIFIEGLNTSYANFLAHRLNSNETMDFLNFKMTRRIEIGTDTSVTDFVSRPIVCAAYTTCRLHISGSTSSTAKLLMTRLAIAIIILCLIACCLYLAHNRYQAELDKMGATDNQAPLRKYLRNPFETTTTTTTTTTTAPPLMIPHTISRDEPHKHIHNVFRRSRRSIIDDNALRREYEFTPGNVGMGYQGNEVVVVEENMQAYDHGVKVGWYIKNIDGEPCISDGGIIDELFTRANENGKPYTVVFSMQKP